MEEKKKKIDKWEKTVTLWEEGHNLSEEELKQCINDPEMLEISKDLLRCKNAIARQSEKQSPNPEIEWEQFKARQKSFTPSDSNIKTTTSRKDSHFLWGVIAGVAASFLLILLYNWLTDFSINHNNFIVFQAADSLQQVTLQTSNGEQIALIESTSKEKLNTISPSLSKADSIELTYQNTPIDISNPKDKIETHILSVPRGQNFKLTLSDGTIVWMNAESSLIYPSKFIDKERIVQLNGEAYFQVAKDPQHPFTIKTGSLHARVLGTELNVRNYTSTDTHITLINGKVEVFHQHNEKKVSLNPGEDITHSENGDFIVKKVDVDPYIYWKEGYFYFDDTSLSKVMQELGRWYNVNIAFEKQELMDLKIRYFCVRNETLERAIALLNHMKKIKATISGNTVYIR